MSTKITKHWWRIPRTGIGVHVYRDVLDNGTYIEVGGWTRSFSVAWPRVWRRLERPSPFSSSRIWRRR